MTKKFYHNREFTDLQSKWYKKLEKEGFADIEWYDPKTGNGQGSPYLKNGNNLTTGEIARKYHPELANHYRLCRNFLANGPFYPNLKLNYHQNDSIRRQFLSFIKYLRSLEHFFTRAQSEMFKLYTDGYSIRKITAELRRLHKLGKMGKPPKRQGLSSKGKPYSIFWVHTHLKRLKRANVIFNLYNPEGINVWHTSEADEADQDWDYSSNKPAGEGQ